MRIALVYVDALKGGGYPRDVRWLGGALQQLGAQVYVIAEPGEATDGLGRAIVLRPEGYGSVAKLVDVAHSSGSSSRASSSFRDVCDLASMFCRHLRTLWKERATMRRHIYRKRTYLWCSHHSFLPPRLTAHLFSKS